MRLRSEPSPSVAGRLRLTPLTLLVALAGTALLTLSAKVQVPFWPVPMTFQTFAVLAIAGLAGARLGVLIVALYLAEGLLGLPVFAGTPARGIGLAYMIGPTGGYLVGYLLAALLVGLAAESRPRDRPLRLFGAMALALAVIYACGAAWLARTVGWNAALTAGVVPFVLGDLAKLVLAFALVAGVARPKPQRP
jgi:biotin transport system substrate-specific component